MTYGSEKWALTAAEQKGLQIIQQSMLGISLRNEMKDEDIRRRSWTNREKNSRDRSLREDIVRIVVAELFIIAGTAY